MFNLSPARSIRYFVTPIILVLLLLGVTDHSAADFSFDHAGHSYLVVTNPKTWLGAVVDATSRNVGGVFGELARIDDQAENDAIAAALATNIQPVDHDLTRAPDGGNGAYVWIGATDRQAEGQWIWDGDGDGSGDPFWQGDKNGNVVDGLFNLWGATGSQNEPDDFFFGQDAGGISLDGWPLGFAEQWNDVDESNSLYYLVEFATVASNPGDFDFDNDVDGADFLTWQRGFPAPFNADDLAAWETNYGTVNEATPSLAAVPEASTLLMISLGLLLGVPLRRRGLCSSEWHTENSANLSWRTALTHLR